MVAKEALDVGSKLNLTDLQVLKAQFTSVEKSGGAGIDLDAFISIVGPMLGGAQTEGELTNMFMKMDADCSGAIGWDEFTTFIFLNEEQEEPTQEAGVSWTFQQQAWEPPPVQQWHQEYMEQIRYIPQLDRYMTTGRDAVIKMWNPADLGHRQTYNLTNPAWITDACAIPGEGLIALASTDRSCMFRFLDFRHGLISTTVGSCATATLGGPMSLACDRLGDQEVLVYGDTNGAAMLLHKSTERRDDLYRSVWQLEARDVVQVHQQHKDWVTGVKLVSDLEAVITCSLDRTCLVSDVYKQKVRYKVGVHSKSVYDLDWCHHHRVFASCGVEHDVMVWSPIGRLVGELQGHKASVMGVVSVGDSQMASCDLKGVVKLWDLRTLRCMDTLDAGPGRVSAVAFDPPCPERPGRLLLGGQYLRAWPHVEYDKQEAVPRAVTAAMYTQQLDLVVSVDEESRLSVWAAGTGQPSDVGGVADTHGKVKVTAVVLDPEGRRALTAAGEGVVRMWNFNSGKLLKEFRHDLEMMEITGILFVPPRGHGDNATVIACGWGGQVLLWEDKGAGPIVQGCRALVGHKDDVLCCTTCPPDLLATGDYAGRIIVWSLTSGAERLDLEHVDASNFSRPCEVLLFLPKRMRRGYPPLLSASAGGLVRVWSLRGEGALDHTLQGSSSPGEGCTSLCTDAENTSVFVGDTAGWVRWWDVQHLGDNTAAGYGPLDGGSRPKRLARNDHVPVAAAFFEVTLFRAAQEAVASLSFASASQCLVVAAGTEIAMWSTARGRTACLRKVGRFGQPKPWNLRDPRGWEAGDEEPADLPRPPPPKPPRHQRDDLSPEPEPHVHFHAVGIAAVAVVPMPTLKHGEALPPLLDGASGMAAAAAGNGLTQGTAKGGDASKQFAIPRLQLQRATAAADPWDEHGAGDRGGGETPSSEEALGGGKGGAPRPLFNPPAFERAARVPSFLPTPSPRPEATAMGVPASSASRLVRQATARASAHGLRGNSRLYQGVGETLPRTGRRKSARERLAMRDTARALLSPVPSGGSVTPSQAGRDSAASGAVEPPARMPRPPATARPPVVSPKSQRKRGAGVAGALARLADPSCDVLDLSFGFVQDKGIASLSGAIRGCASLVALELEMNGLGPAGAAALAEAMVNGGTLLTRLGLARNAVGPGGAAALARSLGVHSRLTDLDLSGNGIGAQGAQAIAGAMGGGNTALQTLRLSGNGLGSDGAIALADGISTGRGFLARLDLSDNWIMDVGARALAVMLRRGGGSLTALDLSGNRIKDEGASAFAEELAESRAGGDLLALEELNLLYNPVGMAGAAALAGAVIGGLSCLRTVCGFTEASVHAGERFEDGDASLLVVELRLNSTLVSLDLQGCGISDFGAGALAEGLRASKSLASVNLYCCGIQDAGAEALATALEENSAVTYLNLHLNNVGNAGAKALSAALRKNATLKELSLQANRIGDAGALSLMDGLRENGTVTSFNLWGNRLRAIDLEQITPAVDLNERSKLTTVCGFTNQKVDLSFSGIRDAEAQLLALDLIINPTLVEANLLGNRLSDAGVRVITMATTRRASEGRPRVSLCGVSSGGWRVDLAGKGMGDVDAWLLAMELQANKSITHLDLEGGKVGDPGASALADALRSNRSLARLNLLHNRLGAEGVRVLAAAIEDSKAVRTVCGITEPTAEVSGSGMSDVRLLEILASGLKTSESLTSLNVLGCAVGPAGARAIMAALEGGAGGQRRMKTVCGFHDATVDLSDSDVFHVSVLEVELRINTILTDLNLRSCKVGSKGAAAVAAGLRSNATLVRLNLWGCGVDDEGAKLLMEAVSRNRALQQLDLGGNWQGTVPTEIVDRGAGAVVEFMREIGREGGTTLPRVKWMLVGRGEAGKTSMINTLRRPEDGPQLAEAWDRTVMLNVLEWVPPGGVVRKGARPAIDELVVSVWDCGGQEDYWRVGNQMFLTDLRTLYVLVFDLSHTPPSVRDPGLASGEEWGELHELRRLRDYIATLLAHVPSCSMYLVGTKADGLTLAGRDSDPRPAVHPAEGDAEVVDCIREHQVTYARRYRAVEAAARSFDAAVKRQLRPNLLYYEYKYPEEKKEGSDPWSSIVKKAVVRKQDLDPEQKAADLEASMLERELQFAEEMAAATESAAKKCAERAGRLQRQIMEASRRPPRDMSEEAERAAEIHDMAEKNKALQDEEKRLSSELARVESRRQELGARRRDLFLLVKGEAALSSLGPDARDLAFQEWAKRQRTAREFRARRVGWRWRNLRALVDDLMELKTRRRLGAAQAVLESAFKGHRSQLDSLASDLRERIESTAPSRDSGGGDKGEDPGAWLRQRHADLAARLARRPATLHRARAISALDAASVDELRGDLLATSEVAFPEVANVVPASWGRLVRAISRLAEGPIPVMSLSVFREHVYAQCRFSSPARFERAVRFMHAVGILCNYEAVPELQDVVIVRPQWLVDAFKEVIRHDFRHVERLGGRLASTVRGLRTEGRLSEDFDWGARVDPPIPNEVMMALMVQFDLAARVRRGEFLVPSMLPVQSPGSGGPLSAGPARAALGMVVSPAAGGLFERLVARCAGFAEVRGGWRTRGGRGGGFQGFVPSAGGAVTVRVDEGRVVVAGKGSGAGAAVHRCAEALAAVLDESFPGVTIAETVCVCVACLKGATEPAQAVGKGSTLGCCRLEAASAGGDCHVCGSPAPGWDAAGLPARSLARAAAAAAAEGASAAGGDTGLAQLLRLPSLVPPPPAEGDEQAGQAQVSPASRGPGCFGPDGGARGGAAADAARAAMLERTHAAVGGAGIRHVRLPQGASSTQLCRFGSFLNAASSTGHLRGLERALQSAPADTSGALAGRVGALLDEAWSPPPLIGEGHSKVVDFVTRDLQIRAIGAPAMRVVGWRALEELGRLPRSDEGAAVTVLDAMREVAERHERTGPPALLQYEDNPFSGAKVPPDYYPHLDSDTASTPRLRLEMVSHRWLRPSADARKAHPDDEAGSKCRALVEYGRKEAQGPGRRETYFWIDYCSVDQDDPAAGIAALPLYVATCTGGMLVLGDDEYDDRAWCRVEQALCAALCSRPVITMVPMPGSTEASSLGRYRWGHKKALLPPTEGKVTTRRDMQDVSSLADVAARHYGRAWVYGAAEMGRLLSGVAVGGELAYGAGATEVALEVVRLRRLDKEPPEGWHREAAEPALGEGGGGG